MRRSGWPCAKRLTKKNRLENIPKSGPKKINFSMFYLMMDSVFFFFVSFHFIGLNCFFNILVCEMSEKPPIDDTNEINLKKQRNNNLLEKISKCT